MRTSVSPKFRQLVLAKYPILENREPWLRFFRYLSFGSFFDQETHQLVLPTKTIAEDFYEKPYTHSFNGKQKLEEFRDQVLPGLKWSEHAYSAPNSYKGKARQIICLGFDAELHEALREECLSHSEQQVDFVSGRPQQRENRYQEAAAATAAYQSNLAAIALNPTQRKIVDYLSRVKSGHLLLRKLNENQGHVRTTIESLPANVQEIQGRILASVSQNPHVYYLPSERARTCRLSPHGDSILGLKSEIRKAATKGWVECDLRSSQFTILAAKLDAPVSKALIESGESLWQAFYRHTHSIDSEPPRAVKKIFKEAIYSICFGKSSVNIAHFLQSAKLAALMSHPIVQELLRLRQRWFQEIKQAGGAFDVWNQWHALDLDKDSKTRKGRRWEGAIAAAVVQSVEMEIIAPIFEIALKHGRSDQFGICLFQHDGATLSFQSKEKQPRAQAKLKNAVEARGRELGVATILEWSQL